MAEKVEVSREDFVESKTFDSTWIICENRVKRYTLEWVESYDGGKYMLQKVNKDLLASTATGFAVSTSFFGEGVERI